MSGHKISVYYIRGEQYHPPFLLGGGEGGHLSVPDFEKGGSGKKREHRGVVVGLKEFLPQIFAWRAYYVPCQKRLRKIKYGFEGWLGCWVVVCKGNQYPGLHDDV